jgi:hypothetical protein
MTRLVCVALVAMALACGNGIVSPGTGLTGDVVRGPVTPVCLPDPPCYAPFSAHFAVLGDSATVATFVTDNRGRFFVALPAGRYTIRPGADAPIISPEQQTREVAVGDSGITPVHLEFDTGIR